MPGNLGTIVRAKWKTHFFPIVRVSVGVGECTLRHKKVEMLPGVVEVEKEVPGMPRPLCNLKNAPDHVPFLDRGLDAGAGLGAWWPGCRCVSKSIWSLLPFWKALAKENPPIYNCTQWEMTVRFTNQMSQPHCNLNVKIRIHVLILVDRLNNTITWTVTLRSSVLYDFPSYFKLPLLFIHCQPCVHQETQLSQAHSVQYPIESLSQEPCT